MNFNHEFEQLPYWSEIYSKFCMEAEPIPLAHPTFAHLNHVFKRPRIPPRFQKVILPTE
jgi:hypothetical protein